MDLFEDAPKQGNSPIYSVSELSGALKKTVEGAFSNIRVRGELGRVVRAASGHMYMDLKDDKSVINSIIWKGVAGRLSFVPEEGLEVVATGRMSTYAARSNYNYVIDSMEIAGAGALMALLEKRKKALTADGLFDPARKQLLPYLPRRIGVVTSRTGAVIRDILHRLADRFPTEVILWPVTVQGDRSAAEVAAAINGFNALPKDHRLRPELIIVARGGGSIEDLWGFNEEIVVRAAAASDLPLISAVGHETDTTLIDYAADKRAPTPTAAAEMAVPVRAELMALVQDFDARRIRSTRRAADQRRARLADISRGLPRQQNLLDAPRQRLDLASSRLVSALNSRLGRARVAYGGLAPRINDSVLSKLMRVKREEMSAASGRLSAAAERFIAQQKRTMQNKVDRLTPNQVLRLHDEKSRQLSNTSARLHPAVLRAVSKANDRLAAHGRLLDALSYQRILDRGYAVIRDENDKVLMRAEQTRRASSIVIEQADGATIAKIKE